MAARTLATQPAVIKRILDHLRRREKVSRPPPHAPHPLASCVFR
jgi:hypothetical protein